MQPMDTQIVVRVTQLKIATTMGTVTSQFYLGLDMTIILETQILDSDIKDVDSIKDINRKKYNKTDKSNIWPLTNILMSKMAYG